ncbi:UDP-2,3-diacylglucosamine hydrolase [Zhongshania aliphaticivorans]|uniref:UDP-2,3-diacylglucosamine hydrolase n=1 Tax=Zhongshania aliphaticivorans TaxID=1470434 RepID=A0A5S9P1H4_9GAMM|nr:UDP-2,3-diacylglucosamine diphosphatase [Zhongshania aliphaticivorans]CAA0089938.1 UDP-2,3-diacylglucosamine hydrolase [Zhongshania aliphaticivorans]CAA0097082.1 UDP-2,3-diacylglucosamine hydrolase [Zhongshania aliphaticivorans]
MTTLFISDLHLDETRPDITRAFFHFLQTTALKAKSLYILGDFFEGWIGDDDTSDLIQSVKSALATLKKRGVAIFIMHGNRDFLIGSSFCSEVGATLLPDPSVISLCGEPTLLMHGDSLCTDDHAYMQFRTMTRDPVWQHEALSKSLEERRAIAQHMRMASNEANSNKAEDIMDVNADAVSNIMQQHHCTRLIHGHTHRPYRHQLTISHQKAERIVLGDWDSKLWYLEASDNSLILQSKPL